MSPRIATRSALVAVFHIALSAPLLCAQAPIENEGVFFEGAAAQQVAVGPDLKLTRKEGKEGDLAVVTTYRGDAKILMKVTPPDDTMNTVYYVYLNGFEVLTYKKGPMGTEFRGAGMSRRLIKPEYTIKMAGDQEGRVERITIYSPDFQKTYEGFRLKNGELVPWSSEELANWRKMRDSMPDKPE